LTKIEDIGPAAFDQSNVYGLSICRWIMDRDNKGINIASHEGISGSVSDSASGLREIVAASDHVAQRNAEHIARAVMAQASSPATTPHEKRRRKRVKKADLKSVIEVIMASGLGVSGVNVDAINGKFTVLTGKPASASQGALAEWKQRHAR